MGNEHGHCPHCNTDLDGGGIWETGLRLTGDEAKADKYAASYGATRTSGKWGRAIGIVKNDRLARWRCPDCNGEWPR